LALLDKEIMVVDAGPLITQVVEVAQVAPVHQVHLKHTVGMEY
jgi:hypothetical protein